MSSNPEDWPTDSRLSLVAILDQLQDIAADNEKLAQQLAEGEYRFRRLAKAVWQVQEEERRTFALELHDGIGQLLTALINHLKHAGDEATEEDARKSVELATTALAEVRRLSRALRPSVLDDLGLHAALRWLTRTTSEASGLDVSLDWPDETPELDEESETLVFRIVQEALTNVVKHAGATRARILIGREDGRLRVSIMDNGRGFDADAVMSATDRGFGARGMRDRAELFGGKLGIRSAPNEGTSVTLDLPDTIA